jgi:hypothetical protein
MSVLTWLRWGVTSIALLNLAAVVSLAGAYVWHRRLKPKLACRRARQHAFEHLIAHTSLDNHATVSVPSDADQSREW